MENKDLIYMILLPKMKYIEQEVKEIAFLIKDLKAKNLQEVIDYEDLLNYYSNVNYDII